MECKRLTRCGIEGCKQTLFHLDNGQWYCENGHLREGELEVAADDEGLLAHGTKATKVTREKERVVQVLRGRRGFELYLQCYQLVLRKQVAWLVRKKGFPEELEMVVRDLWTLRLQKLLPTVPSPEDFEEKERESFADANSGDQSSQSSYLYTLRDKSQAPSTSTKKRKRRCRRVPKVNDRPKLIATVGLCYLGLLILRVGVSLGDIHRWVEESGMVYLRAIREVPEGMKAMLSAEHIIGLDPRTGLTLGLLHHTVQELVQMFQLDFGVAFPPVSEVLLLERYIQNLGLPPEIYPATQRLASRLSISFTWEGFHPQKRCSDLPEAKLMALVLIAVKLLLSVDGVRRAPCSSVEPAAISLRRGAWDRFLKSRNDARWGLLRNEGIMNGELKGDVNEGDAFAMNDEELNRYMDWYEETWIEAGESRLSEQILDLFPISENRERGEREERERDESINGRLSELHANTKLRDAVPSELDKKVVRPGEQYLWYSSNSELPAQLQKLLQAAADLLAISRDELGKVVKNLETRFREEIMGIKRKERGQRRLDAMEVDS